MVRNAETAESVSLLLTFLGSRGCGKMHKDELRQLLENLQAAESRLNEAVDDADVDAAILELAAAERRLSRYFEAQKEKEDGAKSV